ELARALADAVGGQELREAYSTGDATRIDAALEAALGNQRAQEVRRALQQGRAADALAALRGAGHEGRTGSGPAEAGRIGGTGETTSADPAPSAQEGRTTGQ